VATAACGEWLTAELTSAPWVRKTMSVSSIKSLLSLRFDHTAVAYPVKAFECWFFVRQIVFLII
jgi:hypothetical protein